jgi:hypothetical protein
MVDSGNDCAFNSALRRLIERDKAGDALNPGGVTPGDRHVGRVIPGFETATAPAI